MSIKIFDDPSEDDMDKDNWRYPLCEECEEPILTEYCYQILDKLYCEDCVRQAKKRTELFAQEKIRGRRWEDI